MLFLSNIIQQIEPKTYTQHNQEKDKKKDIEFILKIFVRAYIISTMNTINNKILKKNYIAHFQCLIVN